MQLRPALVIEFGTFQGGSALYFATVLSALPPHAPGAAPHKFKVLTVDIHGDLLHPSVAADARIEAVTASSTDALVEQRVRQLQQQCVPSRTCPRCGQGSGVTRAAAGIPAPCSPYWTAITARRTCCRSCASSRASHTGATAWWWRTGNSACNKHVVTLFHCWSVPAVRSHLSPPCSNVNGHPVGRSHGPGPCVAPPPFPQCIFVTSTQVRGDRSLFGGSAACVRCGRGSRREIRFYCSARRVARSRVKQLMNVRPCVNGQGACWPRARCARADVTSRLAREKRQAA